MNKVFKYAPVLVSVLVLTTGTRAELDPPQPRMVFSKAAAGTFAADWEGIAGRTYFMQWSQDLQSWHYAPFIDFGDGMHSRGMASSTPKGFYRLHYGDFPGVSSLDEAMAADFDGDGLSNIFEVSNGYSPFDPTSTADGGDHALDPDGDGLGNGSEQAAGLDPMAKDNGLLNLEILIN